MTAAELAAQGKDLTDGQEVSGQFCYKSEGKGTKSQTGRCPAPADEVFGDVYKDWEHREDRFIGWEGRSLRTSESETPTQVVCETARSGEDTSDSGAR